jgi:N-acetylglucosamine-6-phosphate deacetylase
MLSLSPTRLFTGDEIIERATVHVRDGRIAGLARQSVPGAVQLDGLLTPGFIDVQVNGGGGLMFNDSQSVETLKTIAAAHRRYGVTGLMATLVSDSRDRIGRAIEAVSAAVQAGVEGILGLHLEGPWLSQPKRGVHPAKHLRKLDEEDVLVLTQTRNFPLMITVAPEQVDADLVHKLTASGVKVSLGHTAASAEDVEVLLAAGATGFTHLFNAMPPIEGRNPGAAGVALAHRDAWAGLILDGIHVHPISARAAFAAKTSRRLMLVSDAMSTVGATEPSLKLFGETISVKDGALRTAGGTLAGAHLDLSQAVRNAIRLLGATEAEALRMASVTPAEFLGVEGERGRISLGARADLVLLDSMHEVAMTWIGGVEAR